MNDAVLQLELNPAFFYRSSLRHPIFAIEASVFDRFVNRRLTAEECTEMAEVGFVSMGDLLQRQMCF